MLSVFHYIHSNRPLPPVLDLASDSGSVTLDSAYFTTSLLKSASLFNMTDTGSDPGISILTSEAKKRSYLDRGLPSRNDRKLRLFIGTWNMNGKVPPHLLADFLLLPTSTTSCEPRRPSLRSSSGISTFRTPSAPPTSSTEDSRTIVF